MPPKLQKLIKLIKIGALWAWKTFDNIWGYMKVYKGIRGYTWRYMKVYKHIWTHFFDIVFFRLFWGPLFRHCYFLSYLVLFGLYLVLFGRIWFYFVLFCLILSYLVLFWVNLRYFVLFCLNLPYVLLYFVWICLILFYFVLICVILLYFALFRYQ